MIDLIRSKYFLSLSGLTIPAGILMNAIVLKSINWYNSNPNRKSCPCCDVKMMAKINAQGEMVVYLPHRSDCELWNKYKNQEIDWRKEGF